MSAACGPETNPSVLGGGGSSEGGDSSTDGGASQSDTGAGDDDGDDGDDGGTTQGRGEVGGSGDTSGPGTSAGIDTGSDDTAGTFGECGLTVRLDECCTQALPTTAEELEAEACRVPWPLDFGTLPEDLVATCVGEQPKFCQLVDCDYAPPASETLELDDDGTCVFVCPEQTSLAYQFAGCGEPPPIVECLPPPPPCAMDYCTCEGETVIGCGQVSEPWAHKGACE